MSCNSATNYTNLHEIPCHPQVYKGNSHNREDREDRKENIFVGFAPIVLARSYAEFHP